MKFFIVGPVSILLAATALACGTAASPAQIPARTPEGDLVAARSAGAPTPSIQSTIEANLPSTLTASAIPTPIPAPTATSTPAISLPQPSPASATTQNKFTQHEFTAKVSNVRLQSQLIESGKSNEDFVTVKVSAILYPEPIVILDVRKATTLNLPEEVKFLVGYTKVNIEGSPEEIAAYWAPSIREDKMKMIRKYYEKNREIMAKHPGLTILATVRHGDDSISVINQLSEKIVIGVTIIEKDGRLFLTDKPKNDLELAIIEASFHD